MINSDITFKAEMLRKSWDINNSSPLNILQSAIGNIDNLTILWFPMLDELSGCCSKTEDDNIICINSKHSKGRQNFTLAHELYHLLYEDTKDSFVCNVNSSDESEKNANKFAECLLIPNIGLHEFIKRNGISEWNLDDIIKCEQYFQISHTAMLCKLRREGLISYDDYLRYKSGVKTTAWNLGYDLSLYEPTNENYALGKIIPLSGIAYDNNLITGGKYDEILINIFRGDMVYNTLKEDDDIV